MRFWITRTSVWSGHPGVEEAQLGIRPRYDTRTFKTFEEYDKRRFRDGRFLDRGTEHEVLPNGEGIRRRIEDKEAWFVEVESLEDLMALNQRYGNLIISTHDVVPSIEIYDGYRE